jgi:hypothetical protein
MRFIGKIGNSKFSGNGNPQSVFRQRQIFANNVRLRRNIECFGQQKTARRFAQIRARKTAATRRRKVWRSSPTLKALENRARHRIFFRAERAIGDSLRAAGRGRFDRRAKRARVEFDQIVNQRFPRRISADRRSTAHDISASGKAARIAASAGSA